MMEAMIENVTKSIVKQLQPLIPLKQPIFSCEECGGNHHNSYCVEEVAKEAKFMREHTTKLEEAVIILSTASYSNLENTMEVINSLKDQVKELAMQIKELTNKFDCNAVTTRSGLATKEPVKKDMEVDDKLKEDIHEEDMIVEGIA